MTSLPPLSFRLLRSSLSTSLVGSLLTWGLVLGTRVGAAESLTLRWGPLTQTVSFDDLDRFAATGEVPRPLSPYRALLTDNLQTTLRNEISLDPAVAQDYLDDILHTPGGNQLLATLQALVPNLAATDLQIALTRAARSQQPLTLTNLLRHLPPASLELRLGTLLSLAAQFQLAQMENAALGRLLRHELAKTPPDRVPPSNLDPFSTGSSQVERWELVLRDRQRERSIPVDIYWSEDTHGPLVVISHGFGADRRFFSYLAYHLASHGLTVVAVEHPGSNVSALMSLPPPASDAKAEGSRILPATEFLDRPRDISYVLDRMEKLNLYSYSLRDRFNTEQVTLIGHSLGGYTGLALAGAPLDLRQLAETCQHLNPVHFSPADWLQCAALDLPVKYANLKDNRIRQLIVTNPLTGLLFGEAGLKRVQVPTLMLASTRDGVTPMAQQQLGPFEQLAGPKYLITAVDGTHLSVGDPENLNANLGHIPFMPELPDGASGNLRVFLQGVSLSFIMQQTSEAKAYRSFLSPSYAEAFSTTQLPLGLSSTLPNSLQAWPRLYQQRPHLQANWLDYGPSVFHLEAINLREQLQTLGSQMMTYLSTSPPSLTTVYWPRPPRRPQLQAHRPLRHRATP
ncbi:MAG TPA: alpha/beta hydrolase [Leptolyngbyaceae cyanobacterium M65_K2018_010]|nr:alpha/beta hydrolase [Leptolyngbyaceae cyanobacterium M65_K2018_010]